PSSKTSIIEAGCIQRSATTPRLSSKPNSANSKPSERTQPSLCHSNPMSQPRGAVQVCHEIQRASEILRRNCHVACRLHLLVSRKSLTRWLEEQRDESLLDLWSAGQ